MNKKAQNPINLERLANGAFAEKMNEALMQVAENIQNPNTDATAKRGITVNIKFAPSKNRQLVNTTISVTTKLTPTEAIDTQMAMGVNMQTGQIEIAEYDGQIRGQMSFQDFDQEDQEETTQEPVQQPEARKPLDLKEIARQRQEKAELVPGRDYDPETGEVTDDTNGRIVSIDNRAAQ